MGITQIIKRNGEIITLNTKEPFCVVKQATQNSSLMGDDYISLQIVSDKWLSFDKGDKIIVDGFDYSIRTTTTRGIEGANHYTFEPIFYGPMYDLMKTIYRNCDRYGKSDRSTFDLTYTIKEFVQVLIFNLNRDYPGLWAFDENNCPETEALTLQFSGNNCLQVLQTLCNKDNFNLEFLITQDDNVRTIHIGKFGQRVNPPGGAEYFEWGKGNGLYKLKEQKVDDKAIITRLWVEGGTTNIRTDYRNYAERLQLPYPRRYNRKKHILYDGTVVEPNTELIGISDDGKRYLEDAQLAAKIGSDEDSKTYDKIFPTRTGKVTALVDGDINAFIDDTMDFDLNAKNDSGTIYLVDGVTAKITFTSGLLAGQQFELEAKGGYDHATKKFRLIPFTDKRGLTIPTTDTEAYRIRIGDTYKITDIFLPESYEQNAEEDLWYAGMDDFKPATQAKAQYSLTLDRLYFLEALSRDAEVCVFKVGDFVPVKDDRFGIAKQIRIQKITRNLLLEQDYQLTLSDTTAISISTQTVLSVIDHERIINNNRLRDLNKARRGWRTTEDLRNMVYDTDGFFDVDNIRPNSIDTNMLTVGSKSQQFVLTGVILQANYGGNPNRFAASAGILSHLTIDPNKIRAWQMGAVAFELPSTAGYYLFAKCSKNGETGTWIMTQTQYKFEPTDDPNNYYFLVGILSTLYSDDNFRDFQTTYGFTRINGNTITTGRIVTSDGECYLDLDGNKFRIGDASSSIDWNVSRDNGISLKNVSVVSESGDVSPLGVYRGVWNASYIYYRNDEVSYTTPDGATATYRYIHNTPTKGHLPTDSVYWGVVAQGVNGVNGDSNRLVYRYSFEKPSKPTGSALTPAGWSDTPDRENVQITHGNVFSQLNGYYNSPAIADNEITKNRITIVTTKPNQMVAIEIWAQSETNFDFVLVGKLDTEGLTRTANYLDRISGPDAKKVVYVSIPTAGTHFVDVAYAKDQSNGKNGDCGHYRIVTVNNCWLSVGTVDGSNNNVVAWSDPIPFSIDTADVERIYRLMSSETTPATPASDEYVDDFVPPLTTENHVVGKSYNVGDVVIGADGNYYECVVTTTTETPIAKSGQFWIISMDWSIRKGWSDNPTGVTNAYRYEYESVRKKKDGKWGAFSTPVLWMVLPLNGEKGDDGKNGDFTEYRYAVSGGKLSHGKAFTASDRNPGSDWTTVMPSVGSLQYLWLTTAKINGETNALRANWTTPIRVTPYDGVDGTPGKDGDVGPALVFRGIYSSSKSYVGSDKRVDVVKYNNHYYVARTDAGTFYNVLPTNTAKWNDFGAEFETIATGFLFAENANIANLIFRNERLESQSQTNGVPNFFLDGLKNIASFGAGSVVFDGASAKLGWLNIVGRELLGFDDDGIQRLRLTPSSLPSVGGASSHEDVIIKATGGDATYTGTTNWEVSFEEDVWCYYGRDDHEDDMHDSLYAYIEFDIAEDNTLLDLSSIQFSCGVKRTNSTQYEWLDCSLSATAFLKVGTQWQTIGSVSLKDSSTAKITIPKKGRIKVSFNGTIDQTLYTDYSGKFTFATQAIWAITAKTEMIIAKDGFMAIYNANYLRMHSTDGLAVKIGNYHFRVTSSDISVSKNGTSWTKLIT
ncbi:hypothetical protein D1647_15580 [Alistipes sp. Z76]|nr:hypothetical protein [Alistipes sp. Z76]NCE69665.1 hypothetical protein [Muribaculaceae bacterium M3]